MATLLVPGAIAFLIAALSVVDMVVPRPYDGVVLEADVPGMRIVRQVVPGSGADRAGIRPGDVIVGIDRAVLNSTTRAQGLLNRHDIGEWVPYLIRSAGHVVEVQVQLGRRRFGDVAYLSACVLGFVFFFVGVFVVIRQPRLPAARVFYTMCCLFMLFLVCRLRPASYSWVDSFVLTTGTVALLFLPATFLHFFLIFPRPIWTWRRDPIANVLGAIFRISHDMVPIYLLPPAVYIAVVAWARHRDSPVALISGAPAANWWVMVAYMMLGLGALGLSAAFLPETRLRRGAGLVFVGSVFGVVPFIVLAVAFPSFLHTERFLFVGVAPLILVPVTFAYAIVRFGLLDIRVILRKSLLYTVTTALVTALYALGIAFFTWIFRGTELAASPYFPVVFALAIVLLFEPLRQRLQGPVDRFFFAERVRLQRAIVEMGEAFGEHMDLGPVVRELVERLPGLLGVHFAALYLSEGGVVRRVAGPSELPAELTDLSLLTDQLHRQGSLVRLDQLAPLRLISPAVHRLASDLGERGVEVVGQLASPRRFVGLVMLSGKSGQMTWEQEELDLLRGLLHQAAIALETSILLDERARRAELERELEIASAIQTSLLPQRLELADGWQVAATCRPAREVGGDFYTELSGPEPGARAIVYGDVSGKSIPGALMMMAAHEVLHSISLASRRPEELLELANERLYALRGSATSLRGASFVALGYLAMMPGSGRLMYSLAGQPPPLLRRADGGVDALAMPTHRVPLGAMRRGGYEMLETVLDPSDLLFAYSDGVVEAMSPGGEFFGEERLRAVLAEAGPDPETVVAEVLAALGRFCNGRSAYDDLTVLALRWSGQQP